MRIVCPRCVAQYEVDEAAIPEAGREVQCANCENIWFQDYIEMLPDRPSEDEEGDEASAEVFENLDGKSDASFQSARSPQPSDEDEVAAEIEEPEAEPTDILADDDEPDDEDYDDEPASNVAIPPLADDVRDVLQSEAAFSSARAQLDTAAAQALDGDGAEIIAAMDDAEPQTEPQPDVVQEPTPSQPTEDVNLNDLTAFLDAHSDTASSSSEVDEVIETLEDDPIAQTDEGEPESDFDPLADLEAIRSQLRDLEADDQPEYTPNLPIDDPQPDMDQPDDQLDLATSDDSNAASEVAETYSPTEDAIEADETEEPDLVPEESSSILLNADISTAAESTDVESGSEEITDADSDETFDDDDFDVEKPRHAYRADGGSREPDTDASPPPDDEAELAAALNALSALGDETDPAQSPEEIEEEPQPVEPEPESPPARPAGAAAAAMGLTRPRASGSRARVRTIPGFEIEPRPVEQEPKAKRVEALNIDDALSMDTPEVESEVHVQDKDETAELRQANRERRPKDDRKKALLPDVEELDASLRSEGDQPRRRDREMMEEHEEELKRAQGGGFRRAFVWTVFVIVLLMAVYVMRPQIVAGFPPAAVILDPYASLVDSVRLMIDGLIGGQADTA